MGAGATVLNGGFVQVEQQSPVGYSAHWAVRMPLGSIWQGIPFPGAAPAVMPVVVAHIPPVMPMAALIVPNVLDES